jgi:beta-glucosidase-like glycosyl hydrolase
MTDRELLEMAAKAAGFENSPDFFNATHPVHWNPLTDDGDALRLAVKLGIAIDFDHEGGGVEALGNGVHALPANGDLAAATRRAIVMAAASYGEAMP